MSPPSLPLSLPPSPPPSPSNVEFEEEAEGIDYLEELQTTLFEKVSVRQRLTSKLFRHTEGLPPARKKRRGHAEIDAEKDETIKRLSLENYHLNNDGKEKARVADVAEAARRIHSAGETWVKVVGREKSRANAAELDANEKVAAVQATATAEAAAAAATIKLKDAEIAKLTKRVEMMRGTIGRQMDKVATTRHNATLNLNTQLAGAGVEATARVDAVTAQLEAARDLISTMRVDMSDLEADNFDLEKLGKEIALEVVSAKADMKAATDGRRSSTHAPAHLAALQEETGLPPKKLSVPARSQPAESDGVLWRKESVRHMAKVIEGRGEGDDINNVADALHRHGYLERLNEATAFQFVAKVKPSPPVPSPPCAHHAGSSFERLGKGRWWVVSGGETTCALPPAPPGQHTHTHRPPRHPRHTPPHNLPLPCTLSTYRRSLQTPWPRSRSTGGQGTRSTYGTALSSRVPRWRRCTTFSPSCTIRSRTSSSRFACGRTRTTRRTSW